MSRYILIRNMLLVLGYECEVVHLFGVCRLFNYAFSVSDCVVPNDEVIMDNELKKIRKEVPISN